MAGTRRPRPGDEWETLDGRRIYVDDVSGDTVTGNADLATFAASGSPAAPVGMGVWVGSVAEFERYKLVGPRWAARFEAPVQGTHPTKDPVFDALGQAGTVEHRSMPPSGEAATLGRATYEMTVVGTDEDEARQRIVDALAPFEAVSPANISVVRAR